MQPIRACLTSVLPCQQWTWLCYWQGDPVSSGCWCFIDRVTLSAVGSDVLLTGSPCQHWGLMSYWPCWQGHPVSSGVWCLIDRVTLSAVGVHVMRYSCMSDNRRFWIALISVDWGAVLNFGSSGWPNECSHTEREHICDHMGNAQPSAIAFYLLQSTLNSTWWLDLKFSNVLSHFSQFEKEAPASILAAILTTRVPFAGKMEAWCVGNTDWLIISLSITGINALLTEVSLSIATAISYHIITYLLLTINLLLYRIIALNVFLNPWEIIKLSNLDFHPLKVVGRGRETQVLVGGNDSTFFVWIDYWYCTDNFACEDKAYGRCLILIDWEQYASGFIAWIKMILNLFRWSLKTFQS